MNDPVDLDTPVRDTCVTATKKNGFLSSEDDDGLPFFFCDIVLDVERSK